MISIHDCSIIDVCMVFLMHVPPVRLPNPKRQTVLVSWLLGRFFISPVWQRKSWPFLDKLNTSWRWKKIPSWVFLYLGEFHLSVSHPISGQHIILSSHLIWRLPQRAAVFLFKCPAHDYIMKTFKLFAALALRLKLVAAKLFYCETFFQSNAFNFRSPPPQKKRELLSVVAFLNNVNVLSLNICSSHIYKLYHCPSTCPLQPYSSMLSPSSLSHGYQPLACYLRQRFFFL